MRHSSNSVHKLESNKDVSILVNTPVEESSKSLPVSVELCPADALLKYKRPSSFPS